MACKIGDQTSTELVALHAKFATPEQKQLIGELSNTMTNARLALQESNGVLDLAKYNQAKDAMAGELMRFAMNEDAYARALAVKLAKYWGVQPNTYAKAFDAFTTMDDVDKTVLASLGFGDDTLEIIKSNIITKNIEEYEKSKFINATIAKVGDRTFIGKVKNFFKNIPSLFKQAGVQAEVKIAKLAKSASEADIDIARRDYLRRTFRNDITDDNLFELITGENVDSDTIEAIMTYKYMNGGYIDFEVAQKIVQNKKLSNLMVGNDFWNNIKNIPEGGLPEFIRRQYADNPAQAEFLKLIEAKPRGGDLNDAYVELQKLESSRDEWVDKGINSRIFDQVFPEYSDLSTMSEYVEIKNRVLNGLYEEGISNANLQKKISNINADIKAELFNLKKKQMGDFDSQLLKKVTGVDVGAEVYYIKIKQANASDNLTELAYQSTDYKLPTTIIGEPIEFDTIEDATKWVREHPNVPTLVNQHNIPKDGNWKDVIAPSNAFRFEVKDGVVHLQANGVGQMNKKFREVAQIEVSLDRLTPELYDSIQALRNAQNGITLKGKEALYRDVDQKTLNDYLNVDYKVADQDGFMIDYKAPLENMINRLYGSNITIDDANELNFLKYFVFDNDYWALDAFMKKKGIVSNPVMYTRGEQIQRMYMQANLIKNRSNSTLFDFIVDNQDKLLRFNTTDELKEFLDTESTIKGILSENKINNAQAFFNNMLSVLQDVQREGSFPINRKVTKGAKPGVKVGDNNNYIVAQLMKQDVPLSAIGSTIPKLPDELTEAQRLTNETLDDYVIKAEEAINNWASSQELSDLHMSYSNELKSIQNYYFDLLGWPTNVYSEFKPTRIMNIDDLNSYKTAIASAESYADTYKNYNNNFWNNLSAYVADKNEITELDSLLKYGKSNSLVDGRIVKVEIDDVLSKVLAESDNSLARRLEAVGLNNMSLLEKRKTLGLFQAENILKRYDVVRQSGMKAIFGDVYNDFWLIKVVGQNGIYHIPNQVYREIKNSPDAQLELAASYYRHIIYKEPIRLTNEEQTLLEKLYSPLTTMLDQTIEGQKFTYRDIVLAKQGTNKYVNGLLTELEREVKNVQNLADSFKRVVGEQIDNRLQGWNTVLSELLNRTDNKYNVVYDLAPPKKPIITEVVNPKIAYEAQDQSQAFIKSLNNC